MILSKERIKEIKEIAYKNLMKADNWAHYRKDMEKEKYWSLYRADVRELLSIVKSLEEERDKC
jgi:cytidylate kinase